MSDRGRQFHVGLGWVVRSSKRLRGKEEEAKKKNKEIFWSHFWGTFGLG